MSDDDPRIDPVDPLVQLISDLDQHVAMAPHLGTMLAAEWQACRDAGMPALAAAVLIGTRWSPSS